MLDYFTKNFTFTNFHFLLYGIFITALFCLCTNCKATAIPRLEKLNLEIEKQYILDSLDIPEEKKKFILDTFEKTESFCNDCVLVNKQLHERVSDLESEIKTLDIQASRYRFLRNTVIVVGLLLIIFYFRNEIFKLIKLVI